MSVAGTYTMKVKTPAGLQEGKMTLSVSGESLTGLLEYAAGRSELRGKVRGNTVSFTVKIKTPFGMMKAIVDGSVKDDSFSGIARLPMGSARISGIREK